MLCTGVFGGAICNYKELCRYRIFTFPRKKAESIFDSSSDKQGRNSNLFRIGECVSVHVYACNWLRKYDKTWRKPQNIRQPQKGRKPKSKDDFENGDKIDK